MDLLDNYKKAWENQPEDAHKVSRNEIFKMMHAKSSSIVKWIFIIGLLEFTFFSLIYFFIDIEKSMKIYEDLGLKDFVIISSVICYLILFYFLYKFYVNFKSISVVDDTKNLMTKILKTRKTVKSYVLFNLVTIALTMIIVSIVAFFNIKQDISNKEIVIITFIIIVITALIIAVFWLFYQLLYGVLLKKLNKNYKELAKLDQ